MSSRETKRPDGDARKWAAIGIAVTATAAVICLMFWLVGGVAWTGLAACMTAFGVLVGTWYTLAGRSIGAAAEVRERVVERNYVGVAWYASMLHTATHKGGYERGLRAELTRLSAARLAERHGVNLYQDPATARELIGRDLWPLVDSQAAPGPNEPPKSVPPRAVAELVERLEQL